MDFSGLLQGIISDILYGLLILAGGLMLALIRSKWPDLAPKVLYGVFGVTCIAILWFTFTGHGVFSKQPSQTTPDNVEEYIRKWADNLGLGVTRMPQAIPLQQVYFGLVVTLQNGNPLTVFRGKEKSGYLQIQCPLRLSSDHLAILNKLTKDEANAATQEVLLELARTKLGFQMMTASGELVAPRATAQPIILQQTILLMKAVPIRNDLTEETFAQHVNEIDSAITLVRASTELTLQRYSRLHDSAGVPRITRQ